MSKKSIEASHIFNARAKDYAKKFNDISNYKQGLDYICNNLSREASVLDLACGPGNISKYILEKCPDINMLGMDLAPRMIDIAKSNNPQAKFVVSDIREITNLKQKFEAIIIGFGAPYLNKNEVEKLIKDCSNLLLEGGLLYLSTMEGEYEKSGYQFSSDGKDKMFIYNHESDYLQSFYTRLGLSIVYENHQPYFEQNEIRFHDYIIIGQKANA